jgi:hypothetical protein
VVDAAAGAAEDVQARLDSMTSTGALQELRAAMARLRRESAGLATQVEVARRAVMHAQAASAAAAAAATKSGRSSGAAGGGYGEAKHDSGDAW